MRNGWTGDLPVTSNHGNNQQSKQHHSSFSSQRWKPLINEDIIHFNSSSRPSPTYDNSSAQLYKPFVAHRPEPPCSHISSISFPTVSQLFPDRQITRNSIRTVLVSYGSSAGLLVGTGRNGLPKLDSDAVRDSALGRSNAVGVRIDKNRDDSDQMDSCRSSFVFPLPNVASPELCNLRLSHGIDEFAIANNDDHNNKNNNNPPENEDREFDFGDEDERDEDEDESMHTAHSYCSTSKDERPIVQRSNNNGSRSPTRSSIPLLLNRLPAAHQQADMATLAASSVHVPLTSEYLRQHSSELLPLPMPGECIYVKCSELKAYNVVVVFDYNGVERRYNLREIINKIVNRQFFDSMEAGIVNYWLRIVADERKRKQSISVTTNIMLVFFVVVAGLICTLFISFVFKVVPTIILIGKSFST